MTTEPINGVTDRRDQVALVTGGSQGIGAAVVAELRTRGMRVAALSRDLSRLGEALAGWRSVGGPEVMTVPTDVTDETSVRTAVATVVSGFGRLDVVVAAAGVSMSDKRPVVGTSTEEWRRILDTNLTGTYLTIRETLPHFTDSRGYLIPILSTGAHHVTRGSTPYAASKFGARALTEGLIEESRGTGVRATSVSPGPVDTTIWDHKSEPPDSVTRSRMLRPADIAGIVGWLVDQPARLHIPDITVTPWLEDSTP